MESRVGFFSWLILIGGGSQLVVKAILVARRIHGTNGIFTYP